MSFHKYCGKGLVLALALAIAANAYAGIDENWKNTTGDFLWGTAGNWENGLVPGTIASVRVNSDSPGFVPKGDPIIAAGTTATAWHIDLGDDGWSKGTLTVNGTLNATQSPGDFDPQPYYIMGYYAPGGGSTGNTGTLIVNPGGVISGSPCTIMVGRDYNGTFIMNGGTCTISGLTIADMRHSQGTVYLNAGTLTVTWQFTMDSWFDGGLHGNGHMIIDNGAFVFNNLDPSAGIERARRYIANGWIQAVPGKTLLFTQVVSPPGQALIKLSAVSSSPVYPNLLQNPGFEVSGDPCTVPYGWTRENSVNIIRTSETAAHTGSWVTKIIGPNRINEFQQFGNCAGKTYMASVWAKYTDANFAGKACVEIAAFHNGTLVADLSNFFLDHNDPINTWKQGQIAVQLPANADTVQVNLTNLDGKVGTMYFDDAYLASMHLDQDLNNDNSVTLKDLSLLAKNWGASNFLDDIHPPLTTEDFEEYANQAALDNPDTGSWDDIAPFSSEHTTGTITLLTNPSLAHSGNKAMAWHYDVTYGNGTNEAWVETDRWNMPAVNVSQYDELHIWLNRHAGNSTESIFYLKFLQGGINASNIAADVYVYDTAGSSSSPVGWNEWVIDLHNDLRFTHTGFTSLNDLTNVQCILFGVVTKAGHVGGTGTIDIDDMVFVDHTRSCGTLPVADLNGDCVVDMKDLAIFIQEWLVGQ